MRQPQSDFAYSSMTISMAACGNASGSGESASGGGKENSEADGGQAGDGGEAEGGGESAEGAGSGEAAAGEDPSQWPAVSIMYPVPNELPAEASVEKALNDYLVSINAGVQADIVQMNFGDLSTHGQYEPHRPVLLEVLFHSGRLCEERAVHFASVQGINSSPLLPHNTAYSL